MAMRSSKRCAQFFSLVFITKGVKKYIIIIIIVIIIITNSNQRLGSAFHRICTVIIEN